jgi:hypothetical protein
VGEIHLRANNRLNALIATASVEVENAVHIAVVGDPERGLAIHGRRMNHVIEARRPVEHRVLGMDVEMGERISHGLPRIFALVDRPVDAVWTNHTTVIRPYPPLGEARQPLFRTSA